MVDGYSRLVLANYGALFPGQDPLTGTDPVVGQHLIPDGSGGLSWEDYFNVRIAPTHGSPSTGDVWWNDTHNVLNVKSDGAATMQVGLELWDRGWNNSGITIPDGSVVYPMGIVNGLGNARLAKADSYSTAQHPIAVATVDIPNGGSGQVTVFGDVNGINTSGLSLGPVYLSATVAGAMTSTPPVHPNIRYLVGFCKVVDAVDGVIFVMQNQLDILSYFNGTFRETFDCLVTSDGATITASLERQGGGDLQIRFSDGVEEIDTSPAITIELIAGADASTYQVNYLYIPKSTKVLTKSTSSFPSEEHAKVAMISVFDASTTATIGGAIINQNWNDHDANITTGQGHLSHITQWIRQQAATYISGLDGNSSTGDDYLNIDTVPAPDTVYYVAEGGTVSQLHQHTFPAFDTDPLGGNDYLHVVNDFTTPYVRVQNLFTGITADALGVALGNNKYFNIVIFGVANKTGEYEPTMVNLPLGTYNSLADAQADVAGYDVFEMPREFTIDSSTGFLICRLTIKKTSTSWEYQSTTNLRGKTPQTAAGGGAGGATIVSFPDNLFDVHNVADPTKIMVMDISAISTGNTRILTPPDYDYNFAAPLFTGTVGIGMTSPPYKLSINAGASQYQLGFAYNSQSAVQWILGATSGGDFAFHEEGVGDQVIFKAGGNAEFGIVTTGTNTIRYMRLQTNQFVTPSNYSVYTELATIVGATDAYFSLKVPLDETAGATEIVRYRGGGSVHGAQYINGASIFLAHDSAILNIGASNDLKIFHDGNDSWIRNESGSGTRALVLENIDTGAVVIRSRGQILIQDRDDSNVNLLNLNTGGRTFDIGLAADPVNSTFSGTLTADSFIFTADVDQKIERGASSQIYIRPGLASASYDIEMSSVGATNSNPKILNASHGDGLGYIGTSTYAWNIVYRKSESTHTPVFLSAPNEFTKERNLHIETTRHLGVLRSQLYKQKLYTFTLEQRLEVLEAKLL